MLTSFLVGFKIGFQKIREKEYPQNGKHDKQLNQYNYPYLSSPAFHVSKAINVEVPDVNQEIIFLFRHHNFKNSFFSV
ncbi:MAG TPA: hypothetical protein VKA38_07150 [Draconibacterium sp.]|nr:hypothetical protein [Draconibacterium sp.]